MAIAVAIVGNGKLNRVADERTHSVATRYDRLAVNLLVRPYVR